MQQVALAIRAGGDGEREGSMAWRIVKQPNGLLARFSDVVDNFTDLNMTDEEALVLCREHLGIADAQQKVLAGVQDWKPWTHNIPGSGLGRWNDCLETIKNVHGKKAVRKIEKSCR
jgi:hypothetical protein